MHVFVASNGHVSDCPTPLRFVKTCSMIFIQLWNCLMTHTLLRTYPYW
jgi:hypothetical protein